MRIPREITHELLPSFISMDTVSANSNVVMADYICNYLEHRGFDVDTLTKMDDGKESEPRKVAVVATKFPSNGQTSGGFALAGHMDTVPAGNDWKYDPFQLTRDGDRYYGLGVVDMKFFDALAIYLATELDPKLMKRPLRLLFTYEEESAMGGAKDIVRSGRLDADFGIVGEPSAMNIIRGHKGYTAIDIVVTGKAAHSSDPGKGINAIDKALPLRERVMEIKRYEEQSGERNDDFYPPYRVVNANKIEGGTARNVVADRCVIYVEDRFLPGQNSVEVENNIRNAVREQQKIDTDLQATVELRHSNAALLLPADYADLGRLEDMFGTKAIVMPAATEAGIYHTLGGVPFVVQGPGDFSRIHKPNEYIVTREMGQGITGFREILTEFLYR